MHPRCASRYRFALKVADRFVNTVVNGAEEMQMKPVFNEDGINYIYIQYNNVYALPSLARFSVEKLAPK